MADRQPESDDVQAGSNGLSFVQVLRDYPQKSGAVLAALREVKGLDLASVAKATGIPILKLQQYEVSDAPPSPHDLVALAMHYDADLNNLMLAVGAKKLEAAGEESLGIAAKFDGALDTEERDELRALVRDVAARRKRG